MIVELDALRAIDRRDGRNTASEVYEALHTSILSGSLRPGAILSQVQIAKQLNVSRTPVREAMRMLQEGGLLVSEHNYRSRVVEFDPEDIAALYIRRVVGESLSVGITTKAMTPTLLAEINETMDALESEASHSDFECWFAHHKKLHSLIVSLAGPALIADLTLLETRSARYQRASRGAHLPGWWHRGEAEHRALYEAVVSGNAVRAAELSARHLARTALELLAALAPEFDTSRLRDSLRFAIAGAAGLAKD